MGFGCTTGLDAGHDDIDPSADAFFDIDKPTFRFCIRCGRVRLVLRALQLYACQLVPLLFVFTLVAKIGVTLDQPAITNMLSFYLRDRVTALWSGVALIYSPPLVDILPLYVVLMLASPWVLTIGLRRGWTSIMVVSVALWFLARFDLARFLYDAAVGVAGFNVPFSETGSFQMFAWQFIWMLGLWRGSSDAARRNSRAAFPRWLIGVGGTIGFVCFMWCHAVGQTPFGTIYALNVMFDKWHLGPLRLSNFFALLVLALHFGRGCAPPYAADFSKPWAPRHCRYFARASQWRLP